MLCRMTNGPNVPTVEEQRGDEAKSKLNSGIDMAVQCRNRGVVLAERAKEAKKLAGIRNARGTVNLIAVHGMTAPAMMIKWSIVAYILRSFSISLWI